MIKNIWIALLAAALIIVVSLDLRPVDQQTGTDTSVDDPIHAQSNGFERDGNAESTAPAESASQAGAPSPSEASSSEATSLFSDPTVLDDGYRTASEMAQARLNRDSAFTIDARRFHLTRNRIVVIDETAVREFFDSALLSQSREGKISGGPFDLTFFSDSPCTLTEFGYVESMTSQLEVRGKCAQDETTEIAARLSYETGQFSIRVSTTSDKPRQFFLSLNEGYAVVYEMQLA